MAESAETPIELFAKCEANARRVVDRETFERVLSSLVGTLTFPKSGPEYLDGSIPSAGDTDDLALQLIIRESGRYRDLVQPLKQYRGQKQRWILLARWLQQEEICEPRDFLPPQVYEELTREKRASLGISVAAYQHYFKVEAWRPYFERLLADLRENRHAKGNAKRILLKAGYDERAIGAAQNKRSVIVAVCDWLASSSDPDAPDAPTLRNAHSTVSAARKRHNNR